MSAWIDQIFEAEQVQKNGVVRRSVEDVIKMASVEELIQEVDDRGFHMLQFNDQFIVLCIPGALDFVVG